MVRDVCPICGVELPRKAKACPECGSCEETGWSEAAHASGLDLPDDEFNYEEFVKNELGSGTEMKPRGLHWFWWATGVVLLLGMLYWMFVRIF